MTIDSKNVIKAMSVFAGIFWFIVALCWFRDTYFMGEYEKGGFLMVAVIFLPPCGAVFYLLSFKPLIQAVKGNVGSRPMVTIFSTLWGVTPLVPIMFGLFLVMRKLAE